MKSHRTHIPMLILSVITLLVCMLLYLYFYTSVHSTFENARLARGTVALQKGDNSSERDTYFLYEKTRAAREQLSSFFLKDSQAVSFIENLEKIGDSVGSNVNISSVNGDDTGNMTAGSFAKIVGKVDVTGSWAAVMRTLMLSEVLPYAATIENVALSSSGSLDGKTKPLWKASYTVNAIILVSSSTTQLK